MTFFRSVGVAWLLAMMLNNFQLPVNLCHTCSKCWGASSCGKGRGCPSCEERDETKDKLVKILEGWFEAALY